MKKQKPKNRSRRTHKSKRTVKGQVWQRSEKEEPRVLFPPFKHSISWPNGMVGAPINQKEINREIERRGLSQGIHFDVLTDIVREKYGRFPECVYKYMTAETFCKCFKEDGSFSLRATQPLALNDLTEGIADICPPDDEEALKFVAQLLLSLGFSVNESIQQDPCDFLVEILKQKPGDLQYMFKLALSGCIGVISFSEFPLNLAMWGTYAGVNTGFAVGFNAERLAKHIPIHGMGRVRYLEQPLRIQSQGERTVIKHDSVGIYIDEDLSSSNFGKVLFCKSKEWSHERELRYLIPIDDAVDTRAKDALTQPVRVIRIPSCAIDRIIFGPSMNEKERGRYESRIRELMSPVPELCTFARDPETYKNVFIPLSM